MTRRTYFLSLILYQKFVARKARKFQAQGRLALPVLEFAYLFLAIAHAPRVIIVTKMLPEVDKLLTKLKTYEKNPKEYENGQGYYDDLCLAHFLEGVCCRYIAYPASATFSPMFWLCIDIISIGPGRYSRRRR
jgi:hypothetical protein